MFQLMTTRPRQQYYRVHLFTYYCQVITQENHTEITAGRMTIGKDSRKSSVRASIRAPKFLDKSGGFYDRLDEPESAPLKDILAADGGSDVDDGETLLRAAPSGRWKRRSSRRKQKQAASQEASTLGSASPRVAGAQGAPDQGNPHTHFASRHDADDQALIRDKKRMKREQEEVMKVMKRDTMKTYRKVVDRAFRRGWEAFVANIFSVTLTPVHSSQNKHQHNVVLAEFQ